MYIEYCIINAIVINDMLHINEHNLDTHDNSTISCPFFDNKNKNLLPLITHALPVANIMKMNIIKMSMNFLITYDMNMPVCTCEMYV